jgi:hypothetical protein
MCGCVDVWMCGCVDVWMCGCVADRKEPKLAVRTAEIKLGGATQTGHFSWLFLRTLPNVNVGNAI